jgi:hypothetical protein
MLGCPWVELELETVGSRRLEDKWHHCSFCSISLCFFFLFPKFCFCFFIFGVLSLLRCYRLRPVAYVDAVDASYTSGC